MSAVLEAHDINRSFGAVTAARNVNVSVEAGEVVGIIGANGAGKTTFVNIVTGYIKPSSGRVLFEGRDITGWAPKSIARSGLARSFQMPQLFGSVTVFENLMIALGIAEAGALPVWRPLDEPHRRQRCERTLKEFRIDEYRDQPVGTLPQGVRKLLDIAMAMTHGPRLVLLDEPTSGITSEEKFPLMDIVVGALKEQKLTVLFIEHDMDIVDRYADRVLAFYDGAVIADGPPAEVLSDAQVRQYVVGEHLAPEVLVNAAD